MFWTEHFGISNRCILSFVKLVYYDRKIVSEIDPKSTYISHGIIEPRQLIMLISTNCRPQDEIALNYSGKYMLLMDVETSNWVVN